MDPRPSAGASPNGEGNQSRGGDGASALNVERIADAVYRLMLADVQLEQARSGSRTSRD